MVAAEGVVLETLAAAVGEHLDGIKKGDHPGGPKGGVALAAPAGKVGGEEYNGPLLLIGEYMSSTERLPYSVSAQKPSARGREGARHVEVPRDFVTIVGDEIHREAETSQPRVSSDDRKAGILENPLRDRLRGLAFARGPGLEVVRPIFGGRRRCNRLPWTICVDDLRSRLASCELSLDTLLGNRHISRIEVVARIPPPGLCRRDKRRPRPHERIKYQVIGVRVEPNQPFR